MPVLYFLMLYIDFFFKIFIYFNTDMGKWQILNCIPNLFLNGKFLIVLEKKTIQIISAEKLKEVDSKLIHHEKSGVAVSVIRDKVYQWNGQ